MSWDLRQLCPWINWTEEAQGSEGGANQYDQCVPSAALLVMNMLTGKDLAEPQDITNAEYGAAYHGVESIQASLDFLAKLTQLPAVGYENPGDVASEIEVYGAQGIPTIFYVHCDQNAHIVAGGAFGHACVPVAGDGSSITLWANGFYGGTVTLDHADINAVNYGGISVFHQAITGGNMLTLQFRMGLVRFLEALARPSYNMQTAEQAALAEQIGEDGAGLDGVVTALLTSPEGSAHVGKLQALDAGQISSGSAGKPLSGSISGTVTIS